MELVIGKKTYELKYTFHSLKIMEELDFGEIENIDKKPFKLIGILSILLHGAINFDRNKPEVKPNKCEDLLEDYLNDGGDLMSLFTDLTGMLTETGFFKSLQK